MMRTTDNNGGKSLVDFDDYTLSDLNGIANRNLNDLQKENPDLLVFPSKLGEYNDDVEKSHIFSLNGDKLTTFNLMGFIGRNSTQLTISSRFAKDDHNDYFLHYMLQKVFSINILNFDQTPDNENIWDFLLYLFPFYLKKAYSQGIYKSYMRKNYNDANVKGTIEVKRHIKRNIPFMGKVAYSNREHSYDNNITQLIRHTIEYIKAHPYGNGVLNTDKTTREIVNKFIFVTQKNYNKNYRLKVISSNLQSISHPYYTEYRILQKICLKILRHEKITFGNEKDKVYGLLFDGAWLWEEYLNTILSKYGFMHPSNKTSSGAIYLFSKPKRYKRYPDFWKNDIILDAKYKRMIEPLDRNDMNQIISYMYVKKAEIGGFIHPIKNMQNLECTDIGILEGYGGCVKVWSLPIPQKAKKFENFISHMKDNESEFVKNLNELEVDILN